MAAKTNVSDAADRDIHMPHPIHRIVCTYSHTYTSPPTSYPYLQTYITFRGVYSLLLPHYPALFLPTPSSRPSMADSSASYRVDAHYSPWVGMYVCKPGCVEACMYAEGISRSIFSLSFEHLFIARSTAALLPDLSSDGSVCR
jgi:hypothetical protein